MSRTRATLWRVTLVVCVAVALYVASVSTASAGWFVEGTELAGTAALAASAPVDEQFQLTASQVEVKCSGSALNSVNPKIAASNTLAASSLEFSECKGNAVCPLVGKTISTLPLSAELSEGTLPEDKAVFLPTNSSKIFATIKFEGAECTFAGVNTLTGKQTATLPTGQEENVTQSISPKTATSGELKLVSSSATLKGTALVKLASGKVWAFKGPNITFDPLALSFSLVPTKMPLTILAQNGKVQVESQSVDNANYAVEDPNKCSSKKFSQCTVEVRMINANAPNTTYLVKLVGLAAIFGVLIFNS